jgi:hypothetical protein
LNFLEVPGDSIYFCVFCYTIFRYTFSGKTREFKDCNDGKARNFSIFFLVMEKTGKFEKINNLKNHKFLHSPASQITTQNKK